MNVIVAKMPGREDIPEYLRLVQEKLEILIGQHINFGATTNEEESDD
jgi:hypothetical protein